MTTSKSSVLLKIAAGRVADSVQEACVDLNSEQGELRLDFSGVSRIDPGDLRAMQALASLADDKAVKVGLVGVSVGIYKVLKLAKLAPRFCFFA
jgi:ABC-type transporter Mla MlaB component